MCLPIKNIPAFRKLILYTIDETPFVIGDIPVQPFTVWHHKMPVMVFGLKILPILQMQTKLTNP